MSTAGDFAVATHTYQDKYYDYIDRGSTHSATRIIPMMQAMIDIRSVLDVGCGRGAWLAAWCGHGVDDIVGIDGDYIERDKLPFAGERFIAHDLTRGFDVGRKFDLVQCLEVAEHLPEKCAKDLVEGLVGHGDVVLFSAASPGQGGENHINEQPLSYWITRFQEHGYDAVDALRPNLRTDRTVEPWYRYNAIIFARRGHRLFATVEAPSWQVFQAPVLWRIRNAALGFLPVSAITALARVKHALARHLSH